MKSISQKEQPLIGTFKSIRVKIFPGLLSVLLLSLVWSCEEKTKTTEFTFPMAVGNIWEYRQEISLFTYTDTSGSRQNLDTLVITNPVTATVAGIHIFGDTLSTYEFLVRYFSNGIEFISTTFYQFTPNELNIIAYRSTGGGLVYPKQPAGKQILFKGRYYRSREELSEILQRGAVFAKSSSDSIYMEHPPVKSLEFPFTIGSRWIYQDTSSAFFIEREVKDQITLNLDSTSFRCYQIRTFYDIDSDGVWDEDVGITDYFAREGLVRRDIWALGNIEVNAEGIPDGFKFDWHEKYTLTGWALND